MSGQTTISEQDSTIRLSPARELSDVHVERSENTGSLRSTTSRKGYNLDNWTDYAGHTSPVSHSGSIAEDLLRLSDALSPAKSRVDLVIKPLISDQVPLVAPQQLSFHKRIFDVVFAASFLITLFPVLLLCSIAILLESRGPVLFRQRRLGKGGRPFHIVKFRTMEPNAEEMLRHVLESDPVAKDEWKRDRKLRNDPRISRLGKFLRRTSLDELPQFWNVLVGDMSIVGPRPIVSAEIPRYAQAYESYCAVRPGITGLWQVSGRNDSGYAQRVALDCQYVSSWSTMLDLRIVCRTVKTVIAGIGAY